MNSRRERGFTLLELISVIILISIGSTIMLLTLPDLLDRTQAESQKELLAAQLQRARAQAVSNAVAIQVCGSSDGENCDGSWRRGWLTRVQGTQDVIQSHQAKFSGVTWRGFTQDIVFLPNGTSPSSNGRFEICTAKSGPHWSLVLNRQGRLRSERISSPSPSPQC